MTSQSKCSTAKIKQQQRVASSMFDHFTQIFGEASCRLWVKFVFPSNSNFLLNACWSYCTCSWPVTHNYDFACKMRNCFPIIPCLSLLRLLDLAFLKQSYSRILAQQFHHHMVSLCWLCTTLPNLQMKTKIVSGWSHFGFMATAVLYRRKAMDYPHLSTSQHVTRLASHLPFLNIVSGFITVVQSPPQRNISQNHH